MSSYKIYTDFATANLAEAVKDGDASKIRKLDAGGVNPNTEGENGLPLLQWAMLNQSRSGFEDPARRRRRSQPR